MNRLLAACAVLFAAGHLFLLPPSLEDVDSYNFALGVREFDVARHQPHPPGYPMYVALGKATTAVFQFADLESPESGGLAIWSVIAGTASVYLLFWLFTTFGDDPRRAFWTMILAVATPLLWFTALRPLSDLVGLASALPAQALLAAVILGRAGPGALCAGACAAGFAIGLRSQTFVLTLPLLMFAILAPGRPLRAVDRVAAVGAAGGGMLIWFVPLLIASGGLTNYLVALDTQARQDFEGVEMLWLVPSPRAIATALLQTFIWPWGHPAFGAVVATLAAAGAVRRASTAPRESLVMGVAYGPYAVFHLLFHEVAMVRYALPLVVPYAWLVAGALSARRAWLPPGAAAIAAVSLAIAVPATVAYSREAAPGARAVERLRSVAEAERVGATPAPSQPALDVASHGVFRRVLDWDRAGLPARIQKAPHGHEWLTLVTAWRSQPNRLIAMLADPTRTDLALFDPHARRLIGTYRWSSGVFPYLAGLRPRAADLYLMEPPGWMADRGWALTAEIGGITARDGLGPHLRPSVAWLRERGDEALVSLGGRHLGGAGAPPVRIRLAVAGETVDEFEAGPGHFFRTVTLPPGALRGVRPYRPLQVSSIAADSSGRVIPVALEQFDVQPGAVPMIGLLAGWHEPEYQRALGKGWRWLGPRATLWVRPVVEDVRLTLSGESPLRYFDRAPVVRVLVGGVEVGRFEPASDFTAVVALPAAALADAAGEVTIESDLWFVPGEGDSRQLALKIFEVAASLLTPSTDGR